MKWFQHESSALKDEAIQALMDKEGALGYAIYFMICELCAEKIDETLNPEIKISWPYVEKLTHCRRATVRRVLAGCSVAVRRESGGRATRGQLDKHRHDLYCS